MVSAIAEGTPAAVPEADPKLEVMSLRTMPLSVSTLTPLEPSAGYGPPVSSGISAVAPLVASAAAVVVPAPEEVAVVVAEPPYEVPQPTTVARPPMARSWRARRRVISVDTSKDRPRS